MKVAISAGHNPLAQGATFGALTEHAAALEWIAGLKPALEEYGFDVFVVPTGQLTAKVGAINAEHCDLAVEVHFNSDPAHAGRGSETLYMPGSQPGEQFARCVQAQVASAFKPDRGVKEGWYQMDKAAHHADAFLSLTHCPAVIVEPCFIHEPGVLGLKDAGVSALARGIAEFAHVGV